MVLVKHLINSKVVTGPLEKNSSYSHLDRLRRDLLCIPQFQGGEYFLTFGVALHEAFLENNYAGAYLKLSAAEKQKVKNMVAKLNSHPVVKRLMKGAIKEVKERGYLYGVELAFILDAKNFPIGSDLKTTKSKSLKECIKKALEYGYHKQAFIYKKLSGVKEFFFIFIDKDEPHEIYIVNSKDFKEHNKYAEKEVEFLLYFYKHYGQIITEENKHKYSLNNNLPMAKTGKDAMLEIAEQLKQFKESQKAAAKADKELNKQRAALEKLVNKFPARERELYAEKLEKVVKATM
jgi:hypothetical protein